MATAETSDLSVIVKALIHVRSKCATIPKSGHNKFHNYDYVTERDLISHVEPLFTEAGLVLIPSVASAEDGFEGPKIDQHGVTSYVAKYTLAHESGAVWPHPIYAATQGDDRNSKGTWSDKGAAKASTHAYKYVLFRLLMIEQGNDNELPNAKDKEDAEPAPKASGGGGVTSDMAQWLVYETKKAAERLLDVAAENEINGAPEDEASMVDELKAAAKRHIGAVDEFKGKHVEPFLDAIAKAGLHDDGSIGFDGAA